MATQSERKAAEKSDYVKFLKYKEPQNIALTGFNEKKLIWVPAAKAEEGFIQGLLDTHF